MKRPASKTPAYWAAIILVLMLISTPTAHAESLGQTLYVPVYSHIYSGNKEKPFYLSATLSIRNTDPNNAIRLTQVDYHDSNGKRLKRYISGTITLAPLSATRFIVSESDKAGGSGANFLVTWEAKTPASPALIESIMISTRAQQGISFTSRGQVIEEKGR